MPSKMEDLITQFIEATKAHYEATLEGKFRKTNREADKIAQLFREFKQHGKQGQLELLRLTESDDPAVALTAACYSLRFAPEQSVATIKRIKKHGGFEGFLAKCALKGWREDDWHLDEPTEEGMRDAETQNAQTSPPDPGKKTPSVSTKDVERMLAALPKSCPLKMLEDSSGIDERVSWANVFFTNIVNYTVGAIEWSPESSPPTLDERLAWLWVMRPNLENQLLAISQEIPNSTFARMLADADG